MGLIRKLREKFQARKKEEIFDMAVDLIRLKDFNNSVYIAYEGTPIIPVKDEWTSEEIVRELDKIRANYIEVKLKENGLSKIAAVL